MNGFQRGTTTSIALAVGQISATRTATQTLSAITVNYCAITYWEPIDLWGTDWDTQYY